jgi:hypothetical protein
LLTQSIGPRGRFLASECSIREIVIAHAATASSVRLTTSADFWL